jgi:spore germination protein KC
MLVVLCIWLSGCYDAREIDDLAYVMAIGLDKGTSNVLRITLQISLPTKIAGGGGKAGEGGEGKSSTLTTMEAPSIHSGLNMINTYISKQINLSHAKLMVISEELAREGVHEFIHTMIRDREFRPEMFIVVSRSKAEDFLSEVKPILEENPS